MPRAQSSRIGRAMPRMESASAPTAHGRRANIAPIRTNTEHGQCTQPPT
jgi:hypothetical protein